MIIAGSVGVEQRLRRHRHQHDLDLLEPRGQRCRLYLDGLGFKDQAPDNTGTQFLWNGTSFSAPTISGAVALMAQAFPNLTGKQIVSILFQTADDLGAAGRRFRLRSWPA